ncbi:MAG: hypothetical protein LBU94_04710 [Clostridiales bacterium]|jgi:UDP-N-acetylmuramate-alanine ligase|nr:hypothetical protein [Clostridiales bacterium]
MAKPCVNIGVFMDPDYDLIANCVLSIVNYCALNINKITIKPILHETNYKMKHNVILVNTTTRRIDFEKALDNVDDGGVLVINADERGIDLLNFKRPINVISYGFNPKSTVTVSSVTKEEYLSVQCCVQRGFYSLSGDFIEPMEFSFNIGDQNATTHHVLASVIVSALCGCSITQMESLYLIPMPCFD